MFLFLAPNLWRSPIINTAREPYEERKGNRHEICISALSALALLLSLGASAPKAAAQTITAAPTTMSFQGRLAKKDGTPVPDGTHTLTFRIYDAQLNGNVKWAEQIGSVVVRNGTFSAILGKVFPFTDTVLNGTTYLEITVDTDAPLVPRQQFQSVAYALKANTVPDGAITTAKIADGAITQAKLASGVGGFSLPFAASLSSSSPLFYVVNLGSGTGISSDTQASQAVLGRCLGDVTGTGVLGYSKTGNGVIGANGGYPTVVTPGGVLGFSVNGYGVHGTSMAGNGVEGASTSGYGVYGSSPTSNAVYGVSTSGRGVFGMSTSSDGVGGISISGAGVYGVSTDNRGVVGTSVNNAGVYGLSTNSSGAEGHSVNGYGIYGYSDHNYAGYFSGSIYLTGNIEGPSDVRFKTNILTLNNALNTVLSMRGVNFDWKQDEFKDRHFGSGQQVGFIAQELEKVLPELVHTDKE